MCTLDVWLVQMTDDSSHSRGGHRVSSQIPAGTEIGNYRIEAFLDRGGMASVYEATDLRLNRNVALKVLTQELTEGTDFRERFVRESRFAASIDHPNIVPIYDAGEADGLLYIAMRHVRGSNLAALLRKDGPLEPRRALAILAPVADALDTAHNAGLVHRDVKPANILLTAATGGDGHEHVYLTDFGLTNSTSALNKLMATGHFIGTMAYISPEQIRGEPLDARTDLYAFGCVAYECLTGVPPFVRDDQAALLWAHLNEPAAEVSHDRSDLLRADPVIARVLAKNPNDRYQSCDQFVQALTEALLTGRHSPSSFATAGIVPDPTESFESFESSGRTPAPGSNVSLTDRGERGDTARVIGLFAPAAPGPMDDAPPAMVGTSDPRPPGSGLGEVSSIHQSDEPDGAGYMKPASMAETPATGSIEMSGPDDTGSSRPSRRPATSPPVVVRGAGGSPPGRAATSGPVAAKARSSGRTVGLMALAALAAVAAVLTVVLVVGPPTQLVAGAGKPGLSVAAAPPSSSEGSASTPNSPESSSSAAPTPSTQPPPASIVQSVAIPTVDGDPIPVGETPGFVAISPDGRLAYIANRAAGVVTVLDMTINKVIAQIPVPAGPPQFIAVTPDGRRAYVSIYNADKTINLVAVLDTKTTRLLGTIPVEQKPYALAVTPDQRFVYVPSHDTGHIDIIDVASSTVVRNVAVPANPHWVTFTSDGKFAYIADHESNVLTVLDTSTNTIVHTIPVGTSPHSVAISPDGKQVAVVCFDSNDLYFVDTATSQVQGSVAVGANPQDVTYAPDGRFLYTANVASGTVSVVDTETMTVTASIPTDSPTSVAVLPNGRKAYVTNLNTGTLTVLNTGG